MASWPAQIGPYLLKEKLGSGSFGAVILGVHEHTKREFAVKIISKSSAKDVGEAERIIRELDTLQTIPEHPNILKLVEVLQDRTFIFLVTQLCRGGTLEGLLKKSPSGRLSEGDARQAFSQVTAAVRLIHKQGLCHRDLKLDNCLLVYNRASKANSRAFSGDGRSGSDAGGDASVAEGDRDDGDGATPDGGPLDASHGSPRDDDSRLTGDRRRRLSASPAAGPAPTSILDHSDDAMAVARDPRRRSSTGPRRSRRKRPIDHPAVGPASSPSSGGSLERNRGDSSFSEGSLSLQSNDGQVATDDDHDNDGGDSGARARPLRQRTLSSVATSVGTPTASVRDFPRVVVADFGLSNAISAVSRIGDSVGTPLFCAPEILFPERYPKDLFSTNLVVSSSAPSPAATDLGPSLSFGALPGEVRQRRSSVSGLSLGTADNGGGGGLPDAQSNLLSAAAARAAIEATSSSSSAAGRSSSVTRSRLGSVVALPYHPPQVDPSTGLVLVTRKRVDIRTAHTGGSLNPSPAASSGGPGTGMGASAVASLDDGFFFSSPSSYGARYTTYDASMADVWSLGVILYRLLTGRYPFPAASMDQLRKMMFVSASDERDGRRASGGHSSLLSGTAAVSASSSSSKRSLASARQDSLYAQTGPDPLLPPQAEPLIRAMLRLDPFQRPTAGDIAMHPWTKGLAAGASLNGGLPSTGLSLSLSLGSSRPPQHQHPHPHGTDSTGAAKSSARTKKWGPGHRDDNGSAAHNSSDHGGTAGSAANSQPSSGAGATGLGLLEDPAFMRSYTEELRRIKDGLPPLMPVQVTTQPAPALAIAVDSNGAAPIAGARVPSATPLPDGASPFVGVTSRTDQSETTGSGSEQPAAATPIVTEGCNSTAPAAASTPTALTSIATPPAVSSATSSTRQVTVLSPASPTPSQHQQPHQGFFASSSGDLRRSSAGASSGSGSGSGSGFFYSSATSSGASSGSANANATTPVKRHSVSVNTANTSTSIFAAAAAMAGPSKPRSSSDFAYTPSSTAFSAASPLPATGEVVSASPFASPKVGHFLSPLHTTVTTGGLLSGGGPGAAVSPNPSPLSQLHHPMQLPSLQFGGSPVKPLAPRPPLQGETALSPSLFSTSHADLSHASSEAGDEQSSSSSSSSSAPSTARSRSFSAHGSATAAPFLLSPLGAASSSSSLLLRINSGRRPPLGAVAAPGSQVTPRTSEAESANAEGDSQLAPPPPTLRLLPPHQRLQGQAHPHAHAAAKRKDTSQSQTQETEEDGLGIHFTRQSSGFYVRPESAVTRAADCSAAHSVASSSRPSSCVASRRDSAVHQVEGLHLEEQGSVDALDQFASSTSSAPPVSSLNHQHHYHSYSAIGPSPSANPQSFAALVSHPHNSHSATHGHGQRLSSAGERAMTADSSVGHLRPPHVQTQEDEHGRRLSSRQESASTSGSAPRSSLRLSSGLHSYSSASAAEPDDESALTSASGSLLDLHRQIPLASGVANAATTVGNKRLSMFPLPLSNVAAAASSGKGTTGATGGHEDNHTGSPQSQEQLQPRHSAAGPQPVPDAASGGDTLTPHLHYQQPPGRAQRASISTATSSLARAAVLQAAGALDLALAAAGGSSSSQSLSGPASVRNTARRTISTSIAASASTPGAHQPHTATPEGSSPLPSSGFTPAPSTERERRASVATRSRRSSLAGAAETNGPASTFRTRSSSIGLLSGVATGAASQARLQRGSTFARDLDSGAGNGAGAGGADASIWKGRDLDTKRVGY